MRKVITILAGMLIIAPVRGLAGESAERDSLNHLSWQEKTRHELTTGFVQSVVESDLEHAPASDLRKKFKGFFGGLFVTDNCGGLNQSGVLTSPFMNSDQTNVASRCYWNVACIIDDVPVPFNHYLIDPNQIESITLITDIADKTAYGPVASKGAMLIRTKRGGYDTPLRISADLESGIETPAMWPEYVTGEQYAILNNIAREQSGYTQLYTDEDIKGFAGGSPYDIVYPNVNYRDLFFKKVKPVSRVGFNASAGSHNVKFNVSLNGLTGGELVKIGPASDYSKINLSTSVSAKIGRYLETNAAFNGLVSFSRGGNGLSYIDVNNTPPVAFPIILTVSPDSPYYDPTVMDGNTTVYGVSRTIEDNPYAAQIESGYYSSKRRSGMFQSTVDFDMSWLIPGLKSKTFVNLATFYSSSIGKQEDYLGYYWNRTNVIDGRSLTHIGSKSANEVVLSTATFQSLNFFERLTYDWSKGRHSIAAAATHYMCSSASTAKNTNTRLMSEIGTLKYSYDDRYVLDLVANYSGTPLFRERHKYGFFPAAGLAWNASNESFLRKVSWIDKLRFRAQVGELGDLDIYGFADNQWQSSYNQNTSSSYHFGPLNGASWFGQLVDYLSSSGMSRMSNTDLTWPRILEVDAGVEFSFLDCFDTYFNYFWEDEHDVIANVSSAIPASYGLVTGAGATESFVGQASNYTEYIHKGWEAGIDYHKNWNDFGFNIGLIGRHWDVINQKLVADFYTYDYQKQSGHHASEHWGLVYDGRFTSQEEIDSAPLYDADTRIGDIRYKDLNGDGKIDSNDKTFIGGGNAKLRYTVNLGLRYKNFDLNVVGSGNAFFKTYISNTYFMGGYSDINYSKFIWDNLNRDGNGNVTAVGDAFPRLTYTRNAGNMTCSEYWLRDGGWFRIQSVELGYSTPLKSLKWIKDLRVSLRGANLLTFTGFKYTDPEAPVAGIQADPIYRALTLGVKMTF